MTENTSNENERWGTLRELVVALLGTYIESIAHAIRAHARRGDKGHDSVPHEFVRIEPAENSSKDQYEYLISPRSKVFFENLLALESILPPRVVASLLRRSTHGREGNEVPDLGKRLDEVSRLLRLRLDTLGAWASALPRLREQLLDGHRDLTRSTLLPEGAISGIRRATLVDLFLLNRKDDLDDRRETRDANELLAERAVLLLSLGQPQLALEVLATATVGHHQVDYAYALTYMRYGASAIRERDLYKLQGEGLSIHGEAHFDGLAAEAEDRAHEHHRAAFERLARAYHNWPMEERFGRVWPVDAQTRERVVRSLGTLAFSFSNYHAAADYSMISKLLARKEGREADSYFGVDLDPIILKLAHELAASRNLRDLTIALQIYEILSPTHYSQLVQSWLAAFDGPVPSVLETITPGSSRALSEYCREQLHRNTTEDARTALFQRIGERRAEQLSQDHSYISDLMLRNPDDDPESYDFEDGI